MALLIMGALCAPAQAPNLAPQWTQQSPSAFPSARFAEGLAYDAARGQAVLFGGTTYSGGPANDTWLWNGTNWTQASPDNSPSARSNQMMVYDATQGVTVMYGGETSAQGSSRLNDTWLWDGANWTQASGTMPPARSSASMAYDAATGQVILFGGLGTSNSDLGDTWIWNGTTWTQQTGLSISPSARYGASMAYDAALGQVILFGGFDYTGVEDNDTWAWNGSGWTQLTTTGAPTARDSAGMEYDPLLGQVILFGGETALGASYLNDSWVLTGNSASNLTWTQQTYSTNPAIRTGSPMVYDPAAGQVILFGGYSNTVTTSTYSDTWYWGAQQNFGSVNVCPGGQTSPAPCSNTLTLTYNVATTTTFGTPQVVTQGATGLDFSLSSGSTCSGSVSAGNTCTVIVTFAPQAPGLRVGAVELFSSSNSTTPLATTQIYGMGQAPLLAFGGIPGGAPDNGQYSGQYTLGSPEGIAVDAGGDIFIANTGGNNVVKLAANGGGVGNVGVGVNFPQSVAVDGAGDVFIGQIGPSVIEVPAGCTQLSCQISLGALSSASFVAVDAAGNLFVADSALNEIVEIPAASPGSQSVLYNPGGSFTPGGIALDSSGNLYIADYGDNQVLELRPGASTPTSIGSGWGSPHGVAVDAAGNVYVSDFALKQVIEVPAGCGSSSCQLVAAASSQLGQGNTFAPMDAALDGLGNLYVADYGDNSAEAFLQQNWGFLVFGSPTKTQVGSASAPQSVSFQNIGNQPLTSVPVGQFLGIYNSDPLDFVQVGGGGTLPDCNTTFSLAPGSGCDLSISFEPQSVPTFGGGEFADGLQITDNSLNTSPFANQTANIIGYAQAATGTTYTLNLSATGSGSLISADLSMNCGITNGNASGVCSRIYAAGASLFLNATPMPGFTFAGWGGACASSGTNQTCALTMNSAQTVTASFVPTGDFTAVAVCAGGNPSGCTGSSQTITFNFTATTTVYGAQAVTQGTTGLDFTLGGTDTCNGTFNAGTSCSVSVNFTPLAPGLRLGAVELLDAFGAPFIFQPVSGVGQSAEAAFYAVGSPTAVNLGNYTYDFPVAVDAAGDIYFTASSQVYKSTSGTVQSIPAASVTGTFAMAVDGAGNVFAANQYGSVYEIPVNGAPQKLIYSSLGLVRGLAVDGQGNVYLADSDLNEVVEIPANGGANTVAFGPVTTGSAVVAVAVDAAGDVFAGLNFPGSIVEVPAGCNNTSCQVTVGAGWNTPSSLAVDAAGDLYVADSGAAGGNGQIIQATPGCTQASCQFVLADGNSIAGGVNSYGLALDGQGDVYYVNYGYNTNGVGSGIPTLNEIIRSQASVNLGEVSNGFRGADNPLMIQNIGNEPLTGSVGGVLGVGFGEDPIDSTCNPLSLAPSASCIENFYALPSSLGAINASALASDNSLNGSPATQAIVLNALSLGAQENITATGAGTGSGFVVENPTGINCGWSGTSNSGACSAIAQAGLTISFQENPTAGSTFTGWGGACAGYGTNQICTVFVTAATSVTANFTSAGPSYTVTVTAQGTGSGSVVSNPAGINCGTSGGVSSGSCSASFPQAQQVTLTETPGAPSTFVGWGIDCSSSGNGNTCPVNAASNVTATFLAPGTTLPGLLMPITAGVVYGQGGSFTTGTANVGGPGPGTLAFPDGLAFDSNGNLYLADQLNARVLFFPAGSTTPTRVYGQSNFNGGPANTGANGMNYPQGVALDAGGNLYVADTYNNRVLYFPAGSTTATRVYGQGNSFTVTTQNTGGISADSLFAPAGVAVDSSGNLYVSDQYNNRVLYYPAGSTTATRVYGQNGSFTTNQGNNGGVSAGSMNFPAGIALDSGGNLYVADLLNSRVLFYPAGSTTATQVYGQNGSFTTNAANNGGTSAGSLSNPNAVALDSGGNLYVADNNNNRVLFYPFGSTTATRVYGQGGSFTSGAVNNGGISANSLNSSYGVALDPKGNLYVVDLGNNRLLEYGPSGDVNVCPSGQSTPAPCSNTVTYSYYAPADTSFGATGAVTQGFSGQDFAQGAGSTCVGTVSAGNTCLENVTFTPQAPGLRSGAVELFDTNGNPVATAPAYGIGQAPAAAFGPGTQTVLPTTGLGRPAALALDAVGDVFIADYVNNQIVKITPGGVQTTVPTSGLSNPRGVAVDGAGDLYISDAGNTRVVEIPAGCTAATCQVTVPTTGLNNSNGGLAVDGAGDIFIADTGNDRVVEVTPSGVQTTVVGGLHQPFAVAVDASGDVFVADTDNNRVVEVTAGGVQTTLPTVGVTAPEGVWVDAAGDVFIADSIPNSRIVEIPAGGSQITLFTGSAPEGVVTDGSGDIFIADTFSGRVVEINRSQPPSHAFALTNQGATSSDSPYGVSIQNIGNQTLSGSLITSLGANFALDSSSNCGGIELPPGESCTEAFDFAPATTGYLTGSASFSDNTFNLSPLVALQTINLSGVAGINGQAVTTAVPNVVGLTQAAAISALTNAGLTSGGVYTAASEIVPVGSVIASNPAAGAQVSFGAAVKIQVSNGQPVPPTPNPLTFENNYFVTGDYASAGVTLRGTGVGGVATGTITIPNSGSQSVPDGADILDGFLYWETLENTAAPSGNSGTFLGYPIVGQQIGSDIPSYTDGAFTGTLRAYRADVNNYFQANANGIRFGSGAFRVSLPDGGNALPLTEGASLVVIYRVLSQNFPLKAVVIYDGSGVTTVPNAQTVQGMYGGEAGTGQTTTLSYAGGAWSNTTTPIALSSPSSYSVPLNPGRAYSAVILSAPVANSDNDGILDAWKAGPQGGDFYGGSPGYYDVKTGAFVPLPGAKSGEKDLFVQLDYMCGSVTNGVCDAGQENLFPAPDPQGNDPLAMVTKAFANDGIVLHLQIGNAVPEDTCTDNVTTPGQLCQFPGEPGVIGWKNSLEFSKLWPKNFASCAAGGDCSARFPYGQKDSYHYVLFGHSLAIPAWNSRYGTLTSITVSNGATTIVTADRGQNNVNSCPGRITISGVLGDPSLNGVYNTTTCGGTTTTITLATPGVPNWTYPNSTLPEPDIGITSGTVTSISGYSDLGGADSAVSLALWATDPGQNMSTRSNVVAGTLFHEIGHTIGLTHGGLYYDTPGSYIPTFDVNCKPNYQSVMNYLFQLDLLGPNLSVAYSNQTLETLTEAGLSSVTNLTDGSNNPATFPTSAWYSTTPPAGESHATFHCDGTPQTDNSTYRIDGQVTPAVNPQWSQSTSPNITYDGASYTSLRGYNDLANIDLRQVGATGGEFASLANVLSFGSSTSQLNVAAGGTVAMGSGGTIALGSGGNVTLGSGGVVTLGSGGVVALGSGGVVTLGSGGNATLGSGGVVTAGSNGTVGLPNGGMASLSSGGVITMGSGGLVTLGSGGLVTLGSGGVIAMGSGGNVTIPSTGGSYTLPSSGGVVTLGSGGTVALGSGGLVTLGSGGVIAMGSGGLVTLGSGGLVTLGSGGSVAMTNALNGLGGLVALGSGGTVALGSGGVVTLGSGGLVTLGSGGIVTMGSGGNVTLGSGGVVTLGSGGDLSVGAGGNVTLGSGGTVTLGSGGNVTLGSGGLVTLGSGGVIAMGSGGTVTLGSGGLVTLGSGGLITLGSGGTVPVSPMGSYNIPPSGGTITLPSSGGTVALGSGGTVTLGSGGVITMGSGGTVTLGSGGNVTLGSGGVVALGSGGTVALGSGGTVALGSGGIVTLGSGGASTNELTFDTANSFVRPPSAPTYLVTPAGSVQVNWMAPVFGVVQTYTISRSVIVPPSTTPSSPVVIGSVSGVNGAAPATTFTDANPPTGTLIYTISTTVVPDAINPTPRQSAPSEPAVLALGQTIVLGPVPSSVSLSKSTLTVTATAESNASGNGLSENGQLVSFSVSGTCFVAASTMGTNGVSSAVVTLNGTGSCTITASQAGNSTTVLSGTAYNAAAPVSATFAILPPNSGTQSQTITFAPVQSVQYGNSFSLSASSTSGLPVSFTASGPCTAGATTGTATGSTTGAGLCTVTASAPGNSTYSAASVTQSFPVQAAFITVTANSPSVAYGQPLPALTYTYSGFVGGDSASVISGAPVLSTTASQGSNPGSYPITLSTGTLATPNYSFLYVNGTLTIQSATPTIGISNIPAGAVYGGSFMPAYTYSGTGSPAESTASSTTSVCAVSGGVVSFVGVGTCTLTASATATADYSAATGSAQSFSVGQTAQTITFAQPTSPVTYGASPITLSATSTSGLTVTFSIDSTSTGTGTISGSTLTVTGAGRLAIDANQTGNTDYKAAAQVQRSIVVNKAGQTITFTTNPPASAAYNANFTVAATASSGLAVTFTSSGACSNSGATYTMTAGTGSCSVIANQAGNANYAAAAAVTKTVSATGPVLTVSPSSINFGTVYLDTISLESVKVSNTGTSAATVSTPLITVLKAGSSNEFVIVNLCPSSLAAGKSCTIEVSFVAGAYYNTAQTATLNIMDNAPGSPQPVSLTAMVIDPLASFSPSSLNFGTIKHATSSTLTVKLSNPGATPLNFTGAGIAVTGTNAADFTQTNNCGSSVAAGGSCTITVKFRPATTATFSASLKVTDNAQAGSGTQTVALSGKGN